ncbi:Secondary metabolism regulator laeA [Colletotrichum gloeosporioides]|uniref:Secondary metabolism regulator laeA n=1 Tax=Colletotrichum gloeosporioides TaxID=474922 RepID=A0A8H4CLB3_COLGL|nr:Secondary metabolism regulator laeA [Colletotrichum gloeosporioides]KAF3805989.1 Secondary metabolism regulator laeA [Colletotrichum gloeosporioides]
MSQQQDAQAQASNVADREIVLIADDDDDDAASAIQSSVASSSVSLNSSILDHRFENGRTYHKYKEGKYILPNDETENDRLDLQHHLFRLTFNGRLANAPPSDEGAQVGRVLDLGTGTGIWALEFGDEHPEAEILGVDLSPTQPDFVAPNVKFKIDDIEEPWTYSKKFDYIHSRLLNLSIGNWEVYVKQCFDNLNPGGYVEFNECDVYPMSNDGSLKSNSAILQSCKLLQEATEQTYGRPLKLMRDLKITFIEAGFVDVQALQFKWPTNPWPKDPRFKELATWMSENLLTGWELICLAHLARGLS